MKHLRLFEEFEEMKKPSFFQRAVKGTKRFFGYENKEDREIIEKIHRVLDNRTLQLKWKNSKSDGYGHNFVDNIKEIKPGVIVAYVLGKSLTVDNNEKNIMYAGRELEISDMEYECENLYTRLMHNI